VGEIREETDDAAGGIYLVNNAGVLAPVGPVERTDAQESELHLKVNLLAPMRAAAGFIRGVDGFRGRKVVATISSGAAQRPYYGWSVYCSGKAGVEMWTRVAGFEQSRRGDPVHVFSIAPGIVETDMQASIRSMSEEEFIHRDSFVRYFERGLLADPWELGPLLLRSLDDPQIEQGATVDVRKLYG
jgi:benzil reductase ((S)-benzoin forming)